jgi:hypothetical protein
MKSNGNHLLRRKSQLHTTVTALEISFIGWPKAKFVTEIFLEHVFWNHRYVEWFIRLENTACTGTEKMNGSDGD